VCPQNRNLNGGAWKDLEEQVRDLAVQKGHIYVVCGPIVAADYQTIGANKVVVPSAFFKVVDEVEELTGIDFFPSLPDKVEKRAEAEVDFTKWTVK